MALLTLSFTGEPVIDLSNNPRFWFDLLACAGAIAAIFYLNYLKRLSWPVSQVVYVYVFVILILHNIYGVIKSRTEILHLLWVISIIAIGGLLIESLVEELQRLRRWALRLAVGLSLLYVATIVFFLPGALSLWCLNYWETQDAFKKRN
jgi:hypothetical protein